MLITAGKVILEARYSSAEMISLLLASSVHPKTLSTLILDSLATPTLLPPAIADTEYKEYLQHVYSLTKK